MANWRSISTNWYKLGRDVRRVLVGVKSLTVSRCSWPPSPYPENHPSDPVRITGIASRTMESVQKSLHLLRSRPVRTRPQHQQAMIGPFQKCGWNSRNSKPLSKKNSKSFHSDMRISQFPLMCSWVVVSLFTMRPQCASPKRIDACFPKKTLCDLWSLLMEPTSTTTTTNLYNGLNGCEPRTEPKKQEANSID